MTSRAAREPRARRCAARAGGVLAAVAVLMSAGCGAGGAPAGSAKRTVDPATATVSRAAHTGTAGTAADHSTAADHGTSAGTTSAGTTAASTSTSDSAAAVAGTGQSAAGLSTSTPAAAHLPAGFAVDAVSAVSTRDWWALGTGGNGSLALARTVDGGRSWIDPVLPAGLSRPVADSQQSPGLAFSNSLDGSIVTAAGSYWVTSDGGAHWRAGNRSGAPVMSVAATPDASLVLLHTAAGFALARATAGTVGLTTVVGAGRLTTTIPALATSGRTVVVISGDRRLISTDDGRTFSGATGPCIADLGGQVSVSGSTVVAWCATGMDGSGWISTDGGSHFTSVPGASGANSTAAAPTGSGGALAWADPERGIHLRSAAGPAVYGRAMHRVTWLGLTSTTDGFAIAGATATGPAVLWRTVDGGRSWSEVSIG